MDFNKLEHLVAEFDGVVYDILITWDSNNNCNFYYLNGDKPNDPSFERILLDSCETKDRSV
jgi:hypothetical protein